MSVEVGARGAADAVLRYSVAAFVTMVRDALIPFEVPTEPGRRFFRNAGSARHRGLEVAARLAPVARVAVELAYTLSDHRFQEFQTQAAVFDGNRIPGIPRHHVAVAGRLRGPAGFWSVLEAEHRSGSFADDGNTVAVPGWEVLNVRVGWRGRLGRRWVEPFVGVQNVFDRRYAGSLVVNAQGGRYFEPAPGRHLLLGVRTGG